jgi:multicomponent Na+:H+ antiporter subunit G
MLEIIGLVIIWGGVFFCVVGVVGLIRMPDVYCRLHAAGKVATVGLCGLLAGAAFLMPSIALKMISLAVFAVLTLPVSTHAIAAAAYRHGVPMANPVRDDLKERLESKHLKLNEESSAS